MRDLIGSAPGRRLVSAGACAAVCLFLVNCSSSHVDSRYGVSPSERVVGLGEPVPKGGGVYRVGQPYVVGGRTYYPEYDPHYEAVGLASWYGDDFHGRYTANGEIFDRDGISAAHPTLPMPSYVRVTNLANGRSLIVRINDRGPYAGNRIIDVSTRAARLLGFLERGTAKVRVEFVGKAPVEGSDDRVLEATLRQNEPAPAPWTVKLASTDVAPSFPNQPPPVGVRLPAPSLERVVPNTDSMRSMSFTNGPGGLEGPDQFLNGRGLY